MDLENSNLENNLANENHPDVVGPIDNQPSLTENPKKSRNILKIVIIVFAVALLISGGVAAYALLVKKSPEKVFALALENTAENLKKLENTNQNTSSNFKINGDFNISSPMASDGKFTGLWDGSNGKIDLEVGVSGVRLTGNMLIIGDENSGNPDIYLKLNGLGSISSILGALANEAATGFNEIFTELDDKWILVDRTLLGSLGATNMLESNNTQTLDQTELAKLYEEVIVLLQNSLFAVDENAVLEIKEFLGEEDFNGTNSLKYSVGINKEGLKNMLRDLYALLSSKQQILDDYGINLDGEEDLNRMLEEIDNEDFTQYNADVWVEANGDFVRNVRLYSSEDKSSNYLDIGVPYLSNDQIPLNIDIVFDDQGGKGSLGLGIVMNTQNSNIELNFNTEMQQGEDGQSVSAKGGLKIENTDEGVEINAPDNPINILELLGPLMQTSQSETLPFLSQGI